MKKKEKNNRRPLNINSDELLSKINEGPPPPELVILPRRRTNEHHHQQQQQQQQQSSFDPEQMTDLELSQAIIRARNQVNSIAPRLPDKGARFKANLKLMEDEQNFRNSIRVLNQNQKHPKAKRSRTSGCPELDTVACGTLEASSHSHDLSSMDENDVDVEVSQSTTPSTSHHSTSFEDSEAIGINESLNGLVKTLIAWMEERKIRFEERKRKLEEEEKCTMGVCMKIIDEMEPKIANDAYIRVIKMLLEKEWRVTFCHMSDKQRRDWISSI